MIIKFTESEYQFIKNILSNANISPSEFGIGKNGTIHIREAKLINFVGGKIAAIASKKLRRKISPSDVEHLDLSAMQRKKLHDVVYNKTLCAIESMHLPKGLIVMCKDE